MRPSYSENLIKIASKNKLTEDKLIRITNLLDKINELRYSVDYGFDRCVKIHRLIEYGHTNNLSSIFKDSAKKYKEMLMDIEKELKENKYSFSELGEIMRSRNELLKMIESTTEHSIFLGDANSFIGNKNLSSKYDNLDKFLNQKSKEYNEEALREIDKLKEELSSILSDKLEIKEVNIGYIDRISKLLGMDEVEENEDIWYIKKSNNKLDILIKENKNDSSFDMKISINNKIIVYKNIPEEYAYQGLYEFINKIIGLNIPNTSTFGMILRAYGTSKLEVYLSNKNIV